MRQTYSNVCVEGLGYVLPEESVSSADIEARLTPLYERLRLPAGRLELLSGIESRRFWPRGTRLSDVSVRAAALAMEAAEWPSSDIGALIHGSVCRDHLEPATACRVHHRLNLPAACYVYDVSNACLGLLNGMLQVADLIELGRITAGLVVGTEDARPLVEHTIESLNADRSLTRRSVKPAIASLTIGSASCAILLAHRNWSRTGNRIVGATVRSATDHHELCLSVQDQAGTSMRPLMATDAEALLDGGVATARETFAEFQHVTGWSAAELDRTICHQVGSAHRRRMLEVLGIDAESDHTTFSWLGNTGSAALPVTLADAASRNIIQRGERVALLGIGSGINCVMLGVEWQRSLVAKTNWPSVEGGAVLRGAAASSCESSVP